MADMIALNLQPLIGQMGASTGASIGESVERAGDFRGWSGGASQRQHLYVEKLPLPLINAALTIPTYFHI